MHILSIFYLSNICQHVVQKAPAYMVYQYDTQIKFKNHIVYMEHVKKSKLTNTAVQKKEHMQTYNRACNMLLVVFAAVTLLFGSKVFCFPVNGQRLSFNQGTLMVY